MPCAAVEICKQGSSAAEALPQQRRSRGTASFTKVRAPLLATRAEKSAKMHSDCQKREGAGRTAAPDHAMVSSSDQHRETPPTSTKPTCHHEDDHELRGDGCSALDSLVAPRSRCRCGPSPQPLAETAGGAARRATTRQPTQRFLSVARFVPFGAFPMPNDCTCLFSRKGRVTLYRPIGGEDVTDPRARSIFCGTEFRATRTARRGKLVCGWRKYVWKSRATAFVHFGFYGCQKHVRRRWSNQRAKY